MLNANAIENKAYNTYIAILTKKNESVHEKNRKMKNYTNRYAENAER
jgi:hypothetical protein